MLADVAEVLFIPISSPNLLQPYRHISVQSRQTGIESNQVPMVVSRQAGQVGIGDLSMPEYASPRDVRIAKGIGPKAVPSSGVTVLDRRMMGSPVFGLMPTATSRLASFCAVDAVNNLETGLLLPDEVANVDDDIAWSSDNKTILYVEKDPETLLGMRVHEHVLSAKTDPVIYEEADHSFYMDVRRSTGHGEKTSDRDWGFVKAKIVRSRRSRRRGL